MDSREYGGIVEHLAHEAHLGMVCLREKRSPCKVSERIVQGKILYLGSVVRKLGLMVYNKSQSLVVLSLLEIVYTANEPGF